MPRSAVYNRVAASAASRRGYSDELHARVDALVQEFISGSGGPMLGVWPERIRNCQKFVKERYWNGYGSPMLFLLWPFVAPLIEWLVQVTLQELLGGQGGEE